MASRMSGKLCLVFFFQAKILEWVAIPSLGDLPNPGIELASLALQAYSLRLFWSKYLLLMAQ